MEKFVVSRMVGLAILTSWTVSAQLATNITVTNVQGTVFRNITIDHTNTMGVVWRSSDGGMGQFRWTDLSTNDWAQLKLSSNAQGYFEAMKLKREQEQRDEEAWKEAARQRDAKWEKLDQQLQDLLTASNSEEQTVDAMPASPTNMTPDEVTARDGILKALLDISSATGVGVSRNDYGNLLTKATSAIEFGKTKLSNERHEKFLTCADKALDFFNQANHVWSDYFEYEWEQKQDETLMSVYDLHNLKLNGVNDDVSHYLRADNFERSSTARGTLYYVPFKESLTLYWHAADIYVQKMQRDSQR